MLGMMILTTGDRLIGDIYDGYADDVKESDAYQIEHPFKMDFRTIDGENAFVMTPYVNFMNQQQTIMEFKKIHVLSIVSISEDLKKYYLNTRTYNRTYILPVIERGLKAINEALEVAVDPANEAFVAAMKENHIEEFPSILKH